MCERIVKFIYEKRRECIKELIDNPLLTDEEYDGIKLKIDLLNEILNKIKEQNTNKNDIIIAWINFLNPIPFPLCLRSVGN